MRPQAVALTDPADPQACKLAKLRATCRRRQALLIDGLTQALTHLRRGASALNVEFSSRR